MEGSFFEISDNGRPREEIRIENLAVTPYPDRFRIFIEIEVTPFRERPNLLVVVHDADDRIIGELDIISTMHHKMEFTMHIRGVADPAGQYTVTAELFYETRNPPQDRRIEAFVIPEAEAADE